jgi:hypothetical protein
VNCPRWSYIKWARERKRLVRFASCSPARTQAWADATNSLCRPWPVVWMRPSIHVVRPLLFHLGCRTRKRRVSWCTLAATGMHGSWEHHTSTPRARRGLLWPLWADSARPAPCGPAFARVGVQGSAGTRGRGRLLHSATLSFCFYHTIPYHTTWMHSNTYHG